MGWLPSASASHESTNSNTTRTEYGDHTAILGQDWQDAFNAYKSSVGSSGANANQQTAIDFTKRNLANNPARARMDQTNGALGQYGDEYAGLNRAIDPLMYQPPRQAAAFTSADVDSVAAQTAFDASSPYSKLYSQEFIDPALASYDYGTDRAFSALDARTAGSGAFANSRSGLGYSDLGSQGAMGRAKLEADLKREGLTNSLNYGAGDAGRKLTADTTSATNLLGNRQYNANLLNQNAEFNVNAGYKGDQQKLDASKTYASNLAARSGLSQQVLDNVVKENGIDTQAAQDLFAAGTITQGQLADLLAAARESNGFKFTDNSNTKSNSSINKVSLSVGASA